MSGEAVGKDSDGIVSKYINRKVSRRISNIILKHYLGIKPIHITIISTFIGYTVLPLFIFGYSILAGIVVQTTSILDGVDGELARARGLVSNKGAFADSFLDRTVDILVVIGASYYSIIYQMHCLHYDIIIYLLALSGTIMVSYIHARTELNFSLDASKIGKIPKFASRDIRLFIIFIFSLLGLVYESLIFISIITYIYIFLKFFDIYLLD